MLELLNNVFMSLIPVAFVIALGWFAAYKKVIDKRHSHSFATYVINVSFPCTLFLLTSSSKLSSLLNINFIAGFWLGIIGMFCIGFGVYKILLKRNRQESAQGAFTCSFSDMAFMGIPIFISLLGQESLISIAIGNICTSLFLIPIVTFFLNAKERESVWTMLSKIITKPLVFAPIFGILYSFSGLHLPNLIQNSLELIGTSTSGVSLFTLGLIMSQLKIRLNYLVAINIFLKNIIHPLLMIFLVLVFNIKGIFAKEAILLCAMPTAGMVTIFALKYDVLAQDSMASTMLSTMISLITLPIFLFAVDYLVA